MIGRELGTHKKMVPGLGAHKRSHPDLKHLTRLEMSSPDLSEVRVQRLTQARSVNGNPNVVRVQAGIQMSFPSQEIFWTPAFAGMTDLNYLRALIQVSTSPKANLCDLKEFALQTKIISYYTEKEK